MLIYTNGPPPLTGTRGRQRGTSLKSCLVMFFGLCTSCSSLWQPWIVDPGRPCDGGACAIDLGCAAGVEPCETADLSAPDQPDLTPAGCGIRPSSGVLKFSSQTAPVTRYLRSVWGSDANHVWAVGDGGSAEKWDGTSWKSQNSTTTKNLLGVWGANAAQLVAVGESGTVLTSDGSTWTSYNLGIPDTIRGVWGISSVNDFWGVGSTSTKGFVVHNTGAITTDPIERGLASIWGVDDQNIWATGGGGNIVVRRNGMSWTVQPSGTTSGLNGVWGTSASSIWAVGDTGTILKWDGNTWTKQMSGTNQPLFAIGGIDACNIWAVGLQGALVRWNGATWTAESSGTTNDLGGVWAKAPHDVWLVGDHGIVMRLDPP